MINKSPNQLCKIMAAKERIYHSTMRLLSSNAYDNLTIRNICREAGISIGTFYHYFNGKDDLMTFIIARGYDEYKRNYNDTAMSPPQRVIDIFTYLAAYLSGFGLSFLSNFMSGNNQALFADYILTRDTYNKDVVLDFVRYIQQAQDEGMLGGQYNLRMIYDELNSIFYGNVFNWCLHNGNYELTDTVRKMTTTHFNLYLKEEHRIEYVFK